MPELWPVKIAFGDVDAGFQSRKFVSGPPVDGEYMVMRRKEALIENDYDNFIF